MKMKAWKKYALTNSVNGTKMKLHINMLLIWNATILPNDLPSLSISNTLMASCGVRFLNSLAGSVCRLCCRELSTLTGVFWKKGLKNSKPLTCCVMMPQYSNNRSFWLFHTVPPVSLSPFFQPFSTRTFSSSQIKLNPANKTSRVLLFPQLWVQS